MNQKPEAHCCVVILATLLGLGITSVGATPPNCYWDLHLHQLVCPTPEPETPEPEPIAQAPASLLQTQGEALFDPVWGGLAEAMADADTQLSDLPSPDPAASPSQTAVTQASPYGVGLQCGVFSGRGIDSNYCTIPLSYTIRNEIDPRRRLVLSLPISRLKVERRYSNSIGFGAAYTFPVDRAWRLTPAVQYLRAQMGDFDTVADMLGISLGSGYYIRREGYDLGIGNLLGYVQSLRERAHGGAQAAERHNTILKNGLMWSFPGRFLERRAYWELSVIDTRYFGSETYHDSQQELGVTVGDRRSLRATGGGYRLGLGWLHAGKSSGWKFKWDYWF